MKYYNVLVVLSALLVVSACSQPAYPYSATETYLIMSGQAEKEMPVVENNTKAGDVFLRKSAMKVPYNTLVTDRLIKRMKASALVEKGVGIAAPQVGISRQLLLVQRFDRPSKPFFACLNPEVKKMSEETKKGMEGCLSVPAGYGEVERSKEITLVCYDAKGAPFEETISGFTAVIFQHELDHLNGVLFVDRMDKTESLIPKEQYRKMKKKNAKHPEKNQ
ncbi:peptide deformylase [bacterium]|nr:peptide deformylase [bacterium]